MLKSLPPASEGWNTLKGGRHSPAIPSDVHRVYPIVSGRLSYCGRWFTGKVHYCSPTIN
ncbi:hypothetical protein [Thermosynechococcus sp.]|uniref:hypothetical protein n=1 Tax=Thermosynechococcus sp. TaxID=2814275 RepID=UPI0026269C4A|nr:hypothetical protein [Thermosynechococcus sp.]